MAENRKFRFKGHESFTLREGWLNKGLSEVAANPKVFSVNYGADALGVGPNMAKSIRYWLRCAGLVYDTPKEGVFLTDTGSIILKKDPYIEDLFTLWLIHCRICANRGQATAWNLFFNEFGYEEFEKGQLIYEMKNLAFDAAENQRIADRSIEGDCDAILHMYVKKSESKDTPEEKNRSPFGKLNLIKLSGTVYSRKQPDLSQLPEEVVLYLLEGCLGHQKSIHIDDFLAIANGPGKLLQLRRNALMELLERLQARQKITINRTAGLNMIYRMNIQTQQDIIETYYKKN